MESIKVMPIPHPVKLVIIGHLSDTQELARMEGNPVHQINRINFVKFLISKYPNANVLCDPDQEYQEFITQHPNMKF